MKREAKEKRKRGTRGQWQKKIRNSPFFFSHRLWSERLFTNSGDRRPTSYFVMQYNKTTCSNLQSYKVFLKRCVRTWQEKIYKTNDTTSTPSSLPIWKLQTIHLKLLFQSFAFFPKSPGDMVTILLSCSKQVRYRCRLQSLHKT